MLCNNESLTLLDLEAFTRLNWLAFSGLVISDEGDNKNDANKPLCFVSSRSLLFNLFNAILFLKEFSVFVFL